MSASTSDEVMVTVRMTPKERDDLKARAEEAGVSLETYLGGLIVGKPDQPRVYPEPRYIPGAVIAERGFVVNPATHPVVVVWREEG